MSDDIEQPRRGYNTEDIAALGGEPRPPRRRRARWPWIILATLVLGPLLIFSLWAWIALSYNYSSAEVTGYIQKFEEKGWICSTWEGELALSNFPGATQDIFRFSVRDDRVAQEIVELMRTHDGRIALTYDQHKAVPTSCFGETEFFVREVQPVRAAASPAAPAPPPSPTPGTVPESAAPSPETRP